MELTANLIEEQTLNATVTGLEVLRGPQGEPGPQGPEGPAGPQGVQGPKGKDGSDASATDVRINGTSITVDGVADVPIANKTTTGLIRKFDPNFGISEGKDLTGNAQYEGVPMVEGANNTNISLRQQRFQPIVPATIDYAVKTAMCDGKGAAWSADEQKAARERMNAADADKVYIMQKHIDNLQGIAATEETDSSEAYTKTVPTGAQKWASLDKVGGKTVVWNQHCDRVATTGGTATETDEYVELNAVNESNRIMFRYDSITYPVVSNGHKYLFIGMFSNVSNSSANIKHAYYAFGNSYTVLDNVAHTGSGWGIVGAIVDIGQTGQGLFQFVVTDAEFPVSYRYKKNSGAIIDLTAMFGAGNEPSTVEQFRAMFPADYYPYNAGELVSACVTEVESSGKNMIPYPYYKSTTSINGVTLTDNGDGSITVNGTATEIVYFMLFGDKSSAITLPNNMRCIITISGATETVAIQAMGFKADGTSIGSTNRKPFNIDFSDCEKAYVRIIVTKGTTVQNVTVLPQIEIGTTPTDYKPYREPWIAYNVPQHVIDKCPLYGASAGTVCNEIDFGRKVYVQRVGSVDLGIFNWTLYSGYNEGVDFWYTYDNDGVIKNSGKLNAVVAFQVDNLRAINKSNEQVRVYVPTGTSAPSGLMYYELAEPVEFDLSNVLPDDHYIEVEAGGTVTFKQASTQLPVPSSVTYQVSTKEAIANA